MRRLRKLPLLSEAALALALARVRVMRPFRGLRTGTPGITDAAETARRIEWAVRGASARLPWRSTCLVQALAARSMLERRRIACELYLGARRDEEGELAMHAWLASGGVIVTGGPGHESFAVLTSVSS